MVDIADGDKVEIQGSGKKPYILTNTGGVYSCTCPAWQFQGAAIEKRSCKHLRKYRGDAVETARVGAAGSTPIRRASGSKSGSAKAGSSTAPPLLLAHRFENDDDPTGWWMSEKLDGVRAFWDGTNFISRLGNLYHAPDWFKKDLPKTQLDGELFVGRGEFQKTVSIVRRQDKSDQWKEVRFLVFDAPAMTEVFEDRLEAIETLLAKTSPYVEALDHQQCRDLAHLESELTRIENAAGEGLMLRQPASLYVAGRSKTLLKVKTFYDAEARVCGHAPGRGKHKGRLGALEVELKDGTTFSVGTGLSNKQRDTPPALGSIITFRYQELTKAGVPRFPSFVGPRTDVTWATMSGLPSTPQTRQQAKSKRAQSTSTTKVNTMGASSTSAPAKALKTTTKSLPVAGTGTDQKRYEYDDGTTKKFWAIERFGHEITLTFGKIGSNGQTRLKTFKDEAESQKQCAALAAKKVAKGYVLV